MDVAQILQGLSYKVRSTSLPNFFAFGLSIQVFGISTIIHQQLVPMLGGHVRLVYNFDAKNNGYTTLNQTAPVSPSFAF